MLIAFRPVATRGVLVGRVMEIHPHPDGDLIWLAKVDIGTDHQPQIVWGGVPVVIVGSLVPVALPGTWLPATKDKLGPYKIRRRRYRGEISEGMLCSCAELGWDSSATDRVALLDDSAGLRVGESLEDHYVDWRRIVKTAPRRVGTEAGPADSGISNRPKVLNSLNKSDFRRAVGYLSAALRSWLRGRGDVAGGIDSAGKPPDDQDDAGGRDVGVEHTSLSGPGHEGRLERRVSSIDDANASRASCAQAARSASTTAC